MDAVPGFRSGTEGPDEQNNIKVSIELKEGSEWRFEVPFKLTMILKVTEGIGEIFGTELPTNSELELSGVKYSVYAPLPEGCTLEYYLRLSKENSNTSNEGSEISEYVSEDNCMSQYINLHFALELKRQEISDHNYLNPKDTKTAPKILIIGGKYSGKTTISKILTSYAFKMDRQPMLVNLNPRDGVFSIPGSLTSTPISDNFDLESTGGYGGTVTSGTTYHNPKQPIVKNYGFDDFNTNIDLYKYQVEQLGEVTMERLNKDPMIKNSGCVIDTPPLTIKNYDIIESIISSFQVDYVVVLGNEKLLADLKRKLNHKIVSQELMLLKVAKSEGVVELEDTYIRKCQEEAIKEYFNGNFRNPLSPFKTEITLDDFSVFKVIETSEFNSSLMFAPAGDSFEPDAIDENDEKKKEEEFDKYLKKIEDFSTNNLENLIIAITHSPLTTKSLKDILNANVQGYIHVSKYEESKNKLKVLLPVPGAFPKCNLIATNIGYSE